VALVAVPLDTTIHRPHRPLQRLWAFFNPQDNKPLYEFVRRCSICQRNKIEHLYPTGLLQPLPVLETIWSDIAMDLIEGFPKVYTKSMVLVAVDRFLKYAHFII
jgi:hypothetical protein